MVTKVHPYTNSSKDEEPPNDRLSRKATRNLFSWTLFTEGTRTEERSLWKHEWLEPLLKIDLSVESSASSSSNSEDEAKYRNFEYIEKWQNDVPVHDIVSTRVTNEQA